MIEQSNQEEEYQFEDLGATDVEHDTVNASDLPVTGSAAKMKKKVFIVAGIVIGLVVAYNVIDMIRNPRTKSDDKAKIIQKVPVTTKESLKPIKKIVTLPVPKPKSVVKVTKYDDAQIKEEVSFLNATILELKQKLMDLDSRFADLNFSHQNLEQVLIKQQAAINALKFKKRKSTKKPAMKKMQYYIKAIIPGRVWLEAENGSTITIKRGDKVPGYGTVKHLDYEHAAVQMTSGHVIEFRPEDR